MAKQQHKVELDWANADSVGRSYYTFCLEQALANIKQAIALRDADVVVPKDPHGGKRMTLEFLQDALTNMIKEA